MDISFENRDISIFRELSYQSKRIQESCESVVPDINDDIGKIAAVRSTVLLKSKDITTRGVLINGEVIACLMYITESQDRVSQLKLCKGFSIEYSVPDVNENTVAQIKLSLLSAQARIINPRKVSLCFDIQGDMSCYAPDFFSSESYLPTEASGKLHVRYESKELELISHVCEKTFTVSDQFAFPGGKPRPASFVASAVDFVINDVQQIGTKLIAKGSVNLTAVYISEEANYPVTSEFSTAFSQIIDIGEVLMDECHLKIEQTGSYFDLSDSISGDKLLDMELHAVVQLVCRSKKETVFVSDAYSNSMPASCKLQSCRVDTVKENRKIKLVADERINISEDCRDILSVFVSMAELEREQNKIKSLLNLDVIYSLPGGELSSVRRALSLETEEFCDELRINGARLSDLYIRPDGQSLDTHMSLELDCVVCGSEIIEKVVAVNLNEEEPLRREDYPTVFLVRCSGESLWELAKTYHSSVERISEINDVEGELTGRMLLIPKCI